MSNVMPHSPPPSGLARYQATELDLQSLRSTFDLVEENVHLRLLGNPAAGAPFAAFREGLYFFVLNFDRRQFKIYLGRTNALSRRMREYTSAFQPHSPNDFKLQAFQRFVLEVIPSATIDLYFQRLPASALKEAEAAAIKLYQPLLNELSQPTAEARQALQEAFSHYVRSTFEQRLRQ
jgi:hypothetical protein